MGVVVVSCRGSDYLVFRRFKEQRNNVSITMVVEVGKEVQKLYFADVLSKLQNPVVIRQQQTSLV
jgi:hypothetical protein